MSEINKAPTNQGIGPADEPLSANYFFRPYFLRRLLRQNWGRKETIQVAVGLTVAVLVLLAGHGILAGIILLNLVIVRLSQTPRMPKLLLSDLGIEVLPAFGAQGRLFAWDRVQWRMSPNHILWLILEDKWLRINLLDYPVGGLLPTLLPDQCHEAHLPTEQIELVDINAPFGSLRLPLEWIGNSLRSGANIVDLARPIRARFNKAGTLILVQGTVTLTIHPHDPRLPHILAQPQVARAMAIIEISKPKRRWRG
jgi:hypothetical protein